MQLVVVACGSPAQICPELAELVFCKGPLNGTEVTCPWHGSKFDVRSGAVTVGPARTPVTTYETRVEGPDVQVRV